MNKFHSFSESVGLRRNYQLNPRLWDGDTLKPEVRTALLNFAEAWRKYAGIPEGKVQDILLVGGNASFYYNDSSDIDVHLLVDRNQLGFGSLTEEHLKDKKALWSIRHDVRVKGIPVEPYAQDLSEKAPQGQGVYSLQRGVWVQRPTDSTYDPENDPELDDRVAHWQRTIDTLVNARPPVEEFDALKNKMATMRSQGIARGGELDRDNLVFKALRLSGHLDKMSEYVKRRQAEDLSLKESVDDDQDSHVDMAHEILTHHGFNPTEGISHGREWLGDPKDNGQLVKDLDESGWKHLGGDMRSTMSFLHPGAKSRLYVEKAWSRYDGAHGNPDYPQVRAFTIKRGDWEKR